ncbi:MAG TPA: enoyl-CoA hydratase/isomerase family protein [Thermoanaerobaculia bacterium]|nr:enoyl-CoA hydratase/isomerase family protein [Thermoanaerobaculia bacterium]
MDRSVVGLEIDGSTALVRLNRPAVHNAVDEAVMAGLEGALDRIAAASGVRAVILTGAGAETFSAGGDLRYLATFRTREQTRAMCERMQGILDRLSGASWFTIAAINGNAYGGGCEILTACHLRVAARGVRFQFRQGEMGLSTGWGGGLRLFGLVGRAQALRLLALGEVIEAAEALGIGLVDGVVEPEGLLPEARRWAARVAEKPEGSIRAFLELARLAPAAADPGARARETELFLERWASPEFQKALNAVLERLGSKAKA